MKSFTSCRWIAGPFVLFLVVLVLVLGCSAKTRYVLEIDLLSHIPPESRSNQRALTANVNYFVFLFPFLNQFVSDTSSIEAEYIEGIEIAFPTPDSSNEGDLKLEFSVDVTVENSEAAGTLENARVGLFMANQSVSDVYTEGLLVLAFETTGLAPGTSRRLRGTKTLRPGDPGFHLLEEGPVKLGTRAYFRSSTGAEARYLLQELMVRISVRPFALLP